MNRRAPALLLLCFLAAASGSRGQVIEGVFVHFGYDAQDNAMPAALLGPYFAELASIGVGTVVVDQVRARTVPGCAGDSSSFKWLPEFPGKLGSILDLAARYGMGVYVGLAVTMVSCKEFWDPQKPNAMLAVQDTAATVDALAGYATHPAFRGWYIPDEPPALDESPYPYYANLVTAIKARTPGAPVVVAPPLALAAGGCGGPCAPSALADKALKFRNATGVDIQAWQDSVGSSATELNQWSRSGSSVEQYFVGLADALGQDGLWADVELFTWASSLFQFPGYQPASMSRINEQLWETRSGSGGRSAKRVVWLQQYHMSAAYPGRFQGAERLLAAYKAYYGYTGRLLTPMNYGNYLWETPPSSSYPDPANQKLFDRHAGDPRDFLQRDWTGVVGTAQVVVDLGGPQRIDWVAADLLHDPGLGIQVPTQLDVYCANVPGEFAAAPLMSSRPRTAENGVASAGEYVLGNDLPLAATCRWLRIVLTNPGYWTFLSEVEIIGG